MRCSGYIACEYRRPVLRRKGQSVEEGKATKRQKKAVGQCTHYWIIDANNVGHCIKPGCGAVRDFGKELKKWSKEWSRREG